MSGILFYTISSLGLGMLFPSLSYAGLALFGLNMLVGYGLLVLILFCTHVLFGIGLAETAYFVLGTAISGFVYRFWRPKKRVFRIVFSHPIVIFPLIGILSIAIFGRIDYVPTTNDEFTNWLGSARLIFFSGGVEQSLHLVNKPGYPPGWNLLLAAPWNFTNEVSFGLSASAPFILHVAAAAFVYDIIVATLRQQLGLSENVIRLLAWFFLLLFLTAEALGRLWPLYLLIEPPQIFFYASFFLILMLIDLADYSELKLRLHFLAGGALLAAAYLIKTATTTVLVGAITFIVIRGFQQWRTNPLNIGSSNSIYISSALLLMPILVIIIIWSHFGDAKGCLTSPFDLLHSLMTSNQNMVASAWWILTAIIHYVVSYKTIVFIAAIIGLIMGWWVLETRATVIALGIFTGVYFLAVIVFHWACFSNELSHRELVSIPRYSRVVAQTLHCVGLVMLALGLVRILNKNVKAATSILNKRALLVSVSVLIVLLGGWQFRQAYRSVQDVSDRSLFSVDRRVFDMRNAAEMIKGYAGERLPEKPYVIVINQNGPAEPRKYLNFFATEKNADTIINRLRVEPSVAWSSTGRERFKQAIAPDALANQFRKADVIWPVSVDPWIKEVLRSIGFDEICINNATDYGFFKFLDSGLDDSFECVRKPEL